MVGATRLPSLAVSASSSIVVRGRFDLMSSEDWVTASDDLLFPTCPLIWSDSSDSATDLASSTLTSLSAMGPFSIVHGEPMSSRTTMSTPLVPAQRTKVLFRFTQELHMNDSYAASFMSGGGRPEDDASDASSPTSLSPGSPSRRVSEEPDSSSGVGSLEGGRSRKLRQDS